MAEVTPERTGGTARSAFQTGAVAALVATVAMLALGFLADAPIAPQLVADRLTAIIPVSVFAKILGNLENGAKPLLFAGVVIGQVVVGGLASVAAGRLADRGVRLGAVFTGLLVGAWALLSLVLAPFGGIGLVGSDSTAGIVKTGISFLVAAFVYAGVTVIGLTDTWGSSQELDPGRRRILRFASFGIPTVLAGAYLGRFGIRLAQKSAAAPVTRANGELVSPLTATSDFYIVSKNFVDPSVSLNGWDLQIKGLVDHPRTYQYDELRARPAVKRTTTLECISNEVGGDYISTGEWTGIPLRELLNEVGIQPNATKLVMRAADDYSDSIHLTAAMDPDTMLVYNLNGAPLPEEHGFPARLIVPGIFGMKNVKWLKSIEAVDDDFRGYWQQRGWDDLATVQTMSRIDVPAHGKELPLGVETQIGGIAFAGDRGISKVEVSTDDGKTWAEATLKPPLSPLTWVLWTYAWTPAETGSHKLVVRAWDGTGTAQTTDEAPPLPSGATGLDRSQVNVVRAG